MSKRYFLVKTISEIPLSREQFEIALVASIRRLFGEFGLARIHAKVVRFDETTYEATVACNKEGAEDLQAAIGLISSISETTVIAMTIRVSGTIKGLGRRQGF
jgi:RNase P/RNase MRP subunit POP5